MGVGSIYRAILDTVFPLTCIECQLAGTLWCETCSAGFLVRTNQHCPSCEQTTPYGVPCAQHRGGALDGIVASTWYADKVAKTLVRQWKYEFVREAEASLASIVSRWAEGTKVLPTAPWVVVPLPLHPRRLRERGFNQSAVLAQMLSLELGVPLVENLLVARRYLKKRQADIADLNERRSRNVSNVFHVDKMRVQVPTHVILVDDVYTTGTTMHAAAAALKAAGVKVIWGYAFARGY